jgi:RNA polymerase sigma factor (sigma-70 family)
MNPNDPQELRRYEGLVFKTAQRYVGFVDEDFEDIQQMLRLKVWQALRAFDPARSHMSQDAYVFSCVKNRCKDMVKRVNSETGKARAQQLFIEDIAPATHNGHHPADTPLRDKFERRYLSATHEETYGEVEAEELVLPSTLTAVERKVVGLLYLDFKKPEVASLLGIGRGEVEHVLRAVQDKMADWRPSASETVIVLRPAALPADAGSGVRRAA